jgi:hypothetical protein
MLCYFDSDTNVNLSYIDQIKNVRTLDELKKRLSVSNLDFITSTEYNNPGIYLIEVSKVPELWCAKTFPSSSNVLLNIPSRIIKAVKQKQIRIVILSIIEGDNFTSDTFNGFLHLNNTMKLLGLPKFSLLIISGNLNASQQYTAWCKENKQQELIEFLEGVEWDGKTSNQLSAPIKIKEYSYLINSLNRAHRPHRTEHLFFLAEKKILDSSLVSGGVWFDELPIAEPTYQDVDFNYYKSTLLENYPRTLDVVDIKNNTPNLINNLNLYEDSLLSVVTESHYNQTGGLFITEKTFRPVLVGHPFMILGQPYILKKLQEWGFRTDFDGLNLEFDSIEDDRERFIQFHQSLYNWAVLNAEIKRTLLYKWNNTIKHNFYHYKTLDFKKIMLDRVIDSTESYFIKDF